MRGISMEMQRICEEMRFISREMSCTS